MRKIIVLNYANSSIEVVHIPNDCQRTEDVEETLQDMGFKLSYIYWMSVPDGGTPVFYDLEECPAYVL